jgi:G3E family GTPase
MEKIPALLVTGFLGAGKTTIILHLIEQLQKLGHKVVYIKNEIGSQTTDTAVIQQTHIQTKELLNGCICCTLTWTVCSGD